MKKFLSLILATCLLATTAFMASCGSSDNSSDSGKPDPDVEFDGWRPDNILQRPVEKDDIRIGTYVAFADTATQLSGKDQVERYYYVGLNFMPMICTLPKSGILDDNEKNGGTPLYTPGCIEGLFFRRAWGMPMIVSKFVDENGKEFLLFVNNSQDKIERIEGEYKGKKLFNWFAPGQMLIVEE